ncbi:SDR family oxidoreductase [Mesorhizobium sp. M0862]|uniref:SDR family oxidoreductase n=1 Tax=Mesorhizobium sp. M0862 TaxID=2957015 RepID=UPI003336358F
MFSRLRFGRLRRVASAPIHNAFQYDIKNRISAISGGDVTEALNKAIPLQRHAEPDAIASVALYFASATSSYVTGQVHVVDGGLGS